jgi:transposase
MSRYDLTDFEYRVIEPLLRNNKPRGVPRVDDRRVLNGIFRVLRSSALWRDLPERCGPRPNHSIQKPPALDLQECRKRAVTEHLRPRSFRRIARFRVRVVARRLFCGAR